MSKDTTLIRRIIEILEEKFDEKFEDIKGIIVNNAIPKVHHQEAL